jgi:hypothetical protein
LSYIRSHRYYLNVTDNIHKRRQSMLPSCLWNMNLLGPVELLLKTATISQ